MADLPPPFRTRGWQRSAWLRDAPSEKHVCPVKIQKVLLPRRKRADVDHAADVHSQGRRRPNRIAPRFRARSILTATQELGTLKLFSY